MLRDPGPNPASDRDLIEYYFVFQSGFKFGEYIVDEIVGSKPALKWWNDLRKNETKDETKREDLSRKNEACREDRPSLHLSRA